MKKIATFTLILLCFNSINAQRRNDRFLECGIYTLWQDKAKAIECFEKSPSINARAILERIKNPSRIDLLTILTIQTQPYMPYKAGYDTATVKIEEVELKTGDVIKKRKFKSDTWEEKNKMMYDETGDP